MAIRPVYEGFLDFLDGLGQGDAWALYRRLYLDPHREVLDAAWEQCVGLDQEARRARVERIRPEHYAQLRELLSSEDPATIAREALDRCRATLRTDAEPTVVLLVGFFSPDGFVFRVGENWEIGIGLERYKSWRRLPIIVAHEFAHWVRRRLLPEEAATIAERMVAEGLSVAFSQAVYPERPLEEHLHLSRQSLHWLREHEPSLWRWVSGRLDSPEPALLFGPGADVRAGRDAPPRSWVYLGYRAVEEYLAGHRPAWPSEETLALRTGEVLRNTM